MTGSLVNIRKDLLNLRDKPGHLKTGKVLFKADGKIGNILKS